MNADDIELEDVEHELGTLHPDAAQQVHEQTIEAVDR
jgi:hypothetical protein